MFSTDLSPVQVLFLQAPSKVKIDDMLGVIFRDLTLRRVWNVIKINSFPNDRSRKTQKYFMFIKGEMFEGYEPKPFEEVFINPFTEVNQVQSKILTNFALKKYSTPSGFINEKIYEPLRKEGYISSIPLLKTFGYYSLTTKAKQLVAEFNDYIQNQEQKLESLIDGNREEFINALNETGVYIFYFEKKNPVLYKNIISMLKRIHNSKPAIAEKDYIRFTEAIYVDLSYFVEH
jgi:hypothetical protein